MSEQPVEVVFCDLCEVSVSAAELASGIAVRHRGKVIGPCCLGALRQASDTAQGALGKSGASSRGAGVPAGEGRLMPVAIVLLAAIAAATIFLEQKFSAADAKWLKTQETLMDAQQAQGQVLQRLDMAMDGVARRADFDAAEARLAEVGGSLHRSADADKQATALAKDLAALRQEVRTLAGQLIDYRPLFEEQRGRQQHVLELLAGLRDTALAAPGPAPAVVVSPPAGPAASPAIPGLSAAVLAQLDRLRSNDALVRSLAVEELFHQKNPDLLVQLLPMTKDEDPFVRRLTVDYLRDYKQAAVVEALLAALGDVDENVRDTAWGSLKHLTGQKLPFETTAAKDARARAVQRWLDWWEKSKATFGS